MILTQQLNDFIGFVSSPNQKKIDLNWKSIVQNLVFGLILSIAVYALIFISFLIINYFYNQSVSYRGKDFIKKEYTVYVQYFIVNLFGPLIEELAFRLPLKRKRVHLFISLSLLAYFILCNFYGYSYYSVDFELLFRVIYALIIGGGLTFILQKTYFKISTKALVYTSVIAFSLFHITNYKFGLIMIPLLIIRILPQLYLGVLLSYFRMRFGLVFSYLFHCMNNIFF